MHQKERVLAITLAEVDGQSIIIDRRAWLVSERERESTRNIAHLIAAHGGSAGGLFRSSPAPS